MSFLRPAYRELQVLRADDLEAEQEWRRHRHHCHLLHHHSPGIVQGLRIQSRPGGIFLEAGLAVDPEGYELRLDPGVTLPDTTLTQCADQLARQNPQEPRPHQLDLWLHRGQEKPLDTSTQNTPPRLLAFPVLHLTAAATRGPGVCLGRVVSSTVSGREHFEPPSMLVDEVAEDEVTEEAPSEDPSEEDVHPVLQAPPPPERQEAGAVGSQLLGPSNTTLLDLGKRRRGTVAVCSRATADDPWQPRLSLDPAAGHSIDGPVRCRQGLHTDSLAWQAVTEVTEVTEATEATAPWTLRRVCGADGEGDVLRLELPPPGGTDADGGRRICVGRRGQDGAFEPILRVAADRSTTVHGHLVLEGQLVESSIRADVADPRFATLLHQHWQLGAASGVVQSLARRRSAVILTLRGRAVQDDDGGVHHAYFVQNLGPSPLRFDLDARHSGAFEGHHRVARLRLLQGGETAVLLHTLEIPVGARGTLRTDLEATGRGADGRETRQTSRLDIQLESP